MKKLLICLITLLLIGCQNTMNNTKINITINNQIFKATLENNKATTKLINKLKENDITINMEDYSGFEKVGSLGFNLPTSNKQITTKSGDIVLYNGNKLVLFYGSNSWSYTKIGKIDDISLLKDVLGHGDVTLTLSL